MKHRTLAIAGFALAVASLSIPTSRAQNAVATSGPPEILHNPLLERRVEQGILRPVPLRVELPHATALQARRVLVHYRLWGDPDWTTLELRRSGVAFEGAIPCLEISTVTGDLKYYIRVHDAEGRVIATGASLVKPYLVTIKHDTQLDAGKTKVAKCPDPADCPVGLPGCPSPKVLEVPCEADDDCERGSTCSWRGYCERTDRRSNWLSLSVQQDFGFVRTSGACSLYAQENEGYTCTRADGAQYIGNPVSTDEPVGFGPGPTRIVLGYDRLFYYDTSLGVRASWAIRGEGPTSRGGTEFIPISVAARAAHWFGTDPFGRDGFRPFGFVTAGYGMFDIDTSVEAREDPTKSSFQGGNELEQELDVSRRAGDGFIGLGAGVAFAFTTGTAVSIEAAVLQTFPYGAFLVVPNAGVMLGF